MKITIDTEMDAIIVPNTYFDNIDKKNKVLAEAGITDESKKYDYVGFIKDAFNSAIEKPVLRQSDAKKK